MNPAVAARPWRNLEALAAAERSAPRRPLDEPVFVGPEIGRLPGQNRSFRTTRPHHTGFGAANENRTNWLNDRVRLPHATDCMH